MGGVRTPDSLIHRNRAFPKKRARCARKYREGASHMMDILMLALGFGLFAAGIGYAYACERL
jgi:hypothetical protein